MTGDGGRSKKEHSRSRRSYLKLAGLTATAAGVAGLTVSGLDSKQTDVEEINVVDEGADDEGNEPIDDVLTDLVADDTTLRFPSGTYKLESFRPGPLSNFSMIGDDATLLPPDGSTDVIVGLIGQDITFEGFRFDYRAENTAPQVIARCSDGLTFADCEFVGVADVHGGRGRSAHEYHLMPSVTHPRGKGVIRNVKLADGSTSPSNRGAVWVSGDSAGTLRFENVHAEHWANNSLYVDQSEGTLEVVGSRFVNNDVSGPRIGAANATVRDTTVISDGWVPIQAFTGVRNSRGVWIDDACDHATVEDCEFIMTGPYASDAIVFQDWAVYSGPMKKLANELTGGTTVVVKNCQFTLRDGLQAIRHRTSGAMIKTKNLQINNLDP